MTEHPNVYAALAAAQPEMATIVKGAVNPHFKSKYADLAEVITAVRPALNKHGLALFRSIITVEGLGTCMRTTLAHGPSGTMIDCDVPLIVVKNDMQSFKAACTYASRIGTESVTGTAPDDDDDGNTAAKAAPKRKSFADMKRDLAQLDNELVDCHSVIQVNQLAKDWGKKMDAEGWPETQFGDEDISIRQQVINKIQDRRKELLAMMAAEPEPNILMAGE